MTKRQQLDVLKAELDNERSSFIPHWRDLGEYIFPRRPRFHTHDINKGDKRNQKIIDYPFDVHLGFNLKTCLKYALQRTFYLTFRLSFWKFTRSIF